MLMDNLLCSKNCWGLIKNGITVAPPDVTQEQLKAMEEKKLEELKTKNYMFHSINRSILETILVCYTIKDIWDVMSHKYHGSLKVKRAHLQSLHGEFEFLAI